jgi:hypothetical protein
MKIALCFIISYEHIVNKEELWREWIEPNKDIINVYFYYKDLSKIKSQWILKHTIPPNYIYETSYYYVIPAYLSLIKFALLHDNNSWFCMLTDSCCPIISPKKFKYLFYKNYNKSIISWKPAWWNIDYHKRANLKKLPTELHLANDPWFVLKREHACQILTFTNKQRDITKVICNGGLANESLFAIILYCYRQLDKNLDKKETESASVISSVTHITDWSRTTSPTSPHLFKEANELDIQFIDREIVKNKYAIFIRKVAVEFPNEILRHYIYEKNKDNDNKLIICKPYDFIYAELCSFNAYYCLIFLFFLSLSILYFLNFWN